MNRDNQQVTSEQLAWLAGIWDGEGSFLIEPLHKGTHYSGAITMTNSSTKMLQQVITILDNLGITGHLYLEKMRSKKHKCCYHITIRNNAMVKKFILVVLPYLVAKSEHAGILLKYIDSRAKYKRVVGRDSRGRLTGVKSQGYSEEEIKYYWQLKKLNAFGINNGTSETLRWTPLKKAKI